MFKYITQEIKNCYRFRYVTMAFVTSTLKHRYRRSTLGFMWTVITPFLHYMVMGIVFSLVSKSSMPNFFTYYFTGAVFFSVISAVINRAAVVFIDNENYLKKIYLPKLLFVVNAIMYEFTNFSLTLSTLYVLGNIFGTISLSYAMAVFPLYIFFLIIFLSGISIALGIATVYFRDLKNIVPFVMQALFFATPIFYTAQDIPEKYRNIFELNPLNPFLVFFRQVIMYGEMPDLNTWLFLVGASLISAFMGFVLLKKYENEIVFRL